MGKTNKVNSLMEKAWLVYQCKSATLEEKHEAWQWMIDNETDCAFPTYCEGKKNYHSSLHEFLKKHMEAEGELINKFMNVNEVHECIYHFSCSSESGNTEFPVVFKSFESGVDFLKDRIPSSTISILCETLDVEPYWVHKDYENGFSFDSCSQNSYYVILSPDFKIRKITPGSIINENGLGDAEFESMHIEFPKPI